MAMTPASTPGKALTALRLAIGGGTWIAPERAGAWYGLDVEGNPQGPYVGRLFAIRDAALGVGLLATGPEQRRLWWQVGAACDLFDAAAALLAWRRDQLDGRAAAMLGSTALIATALGIAGLLADGADPR
jgi:hypothetical protein